MTLCEQYLAELVLAGLNGTTPSNPPEQISVDDIIMIARKHHMPYLILSGLVKADIPEDERAKIRPYIHQSMMKTLMQMNEYALLHAAFEATGVVNQPMKGIYLKKIYPQPVMREMSDIDMLILPDSREAATSIILANGYSFKDKERMHDVYVKAPYMVLEAHTALYDETVDRNQYEYFKDFSKAVLNEGDQYTYNFSKEDFYVYMMAHMAKHFYAKGCGVRNLIDIYVYRKYYKDALDEAYLEEELSKCGILPFTRHMEKLANIWLDGEQSTKFYDDLFAYMMDSGIYGKVGNGIWSGFAKDKDESNSHYNMKLRRFYIFPPYDYMEKYYPWVSGKKALLPIAWLVRGCVGLVKKKGKNRREMISHIDENDIKTYQSIYKEMQFDFHN